MTPDDSPPAPPLSLALPGLRAADTLRVAAWWAVALASSWWMLGQLASVLRPLLLAVFAAYLLLPYYSRLRLRLPAPVALALIAGVTTALLVGLGLAVYTSLLSLKSELPALERAAERLAGATSKYLDDHLPEQLAVYVRGPADAKVGDWLAAAVGTAVVVAVNATAGGLIEVATAGLYLLFILLESERFPHRVRAAYPPARAEGILHVAGRINAAIVGYMRAKVLSSFALAAPVWLLLSAFGVRFALLWAVLTFACNFIPYLGSVVSYTLPAAFAFLQFGLGPTPLAAAILLLVTHATLAAAVEPLILGRAVGISPLVILAALSVWGLLWGLPGAFLAVPLTVVMKIVCENVAATRPLARLLGGAG
jgi:AI-2 transport protein TqsA